jgi:Protein of unknown function (DUF1634)
MAETDRTPVLDGVNRAAVLASMALLGLGLVLWMTGTGRASRVMLDLGLVLLMATPALRVATTLVVCLRRRDWLAVAATLGVAFVLGWTVILAFRR